MCTRLSFAATWGAVLRRNPAWCCDRDAANDGSRWAICLSTEGRPMTSHYPLGRIVVCCVVALACAFPASGDTIFRDTFNDGNAEDGVPIAWEPVVPAFPGDYDASSGDFLLIPPPGGAQADFMAAMVRDVVVSDMSVRARVTRLQDPPMATSWVGILGRVTPVDPGRAGDEYAGYEAHIGASGDLDLVRYDSDSPGGVTLDSKTVPFDVKEEDVLLQFDAFGNSLRVWAWRPGDMMPPNPQIDIVDATYASGAIVVSSTDGPNDDSIGVFRFVHVADTHIPASELADVNLDGVVNGLDVGPFVDTLLSGKDDWTADMNGDGIVNGLDVDPFVAAVVGGTQPISEPSTFLLALVAVGVVGAWRKWGGVGSSGAKQVHLRTFQRPLCGHIAPVCLQPCRTGAVRRRRPGACSATPPQSLSARPGWVRPGDEARRLATVAGSSVHLPRILLIPSSDVIR
jgi:hypothetical protein